MSTGELRTVTVEREIPYPAEKIWRALTQPHLMEEWLMKSGDFKLEVGRSFKFSEDWGEIECKVLEVEPHKSLTYQWNAFGLESVVTFTLTKTATGTQLRVEQSGFPTEQQQAFNGAKQAWPEYLRKLEEILGRDEQ
jgi:uncharacterized protein YndB with AHSA1/START domain